jgi:hypothetical protein
LSNKPNEHFEAILSHELDYGTVLQGEAHHPSPVNARSKYLLHGKKAPLQALFLADPTPTVPYITYYRWETRREREIDR